MLSLVIAGIQSLEVAVIPLSFTQLMRVMTILSVVLLKNVRYEHCILARNESSVISTGRINVHAFLLLFNYKLYYASFRCNFMIQFLITGLSGYVRSKKLFENHS